MNIQPSQSPPPFISADFDPPTEAEISTFKLLPLNPSYVRDDYEAVTTSRVRLREFFGIGDPWPTSEISIEDNRHDLEWHADEFKRRSSFTYTVIDPLHPGCAGCVYVYPPTRVDFDVELFAWLRSDRYTPENERSFVQDLKNWLQQVWKFDRVGMPGFETPWMEWNKLRSNNRAMPSPYGPACS